MEIDAPKPKMTDYGRAQFSAEVAFNALVKQAKDIGLDVAPVMGLMYLPTEELTARFQAACREILIALTPKETQIGGSDGRRYFVGDGSVPG